MNEKDVVNEEVDNEQIINDKDENKEKENKNNNCEEKIKESNNNDRQEENKKEETEIDEEKNSINNKLLRLQADFLNYKNRVQKERASSYSSAVCDTIEGLLPVIDNFERAIDIEQTSDKNLYEGVKMIYNQLMEILKNRGLKEIEAKNKKFDPNLHYGVAFEHIDDVEEDTVIEVIQKGYIVNDKVIRPSMVKISK